MKQNDRKLANKYGITLKISLIVFLLALTALSQRLEAQADPPYGRIQVGLERPDKISLEGEWHFKEDPNETGEKEEWGAGGKVTGRKGLVPLPWQLAFDDMQNYIGISWYERTIDIPADWAGKRVVLCADGIADQGKVWVNGHLAGEARDVQQAPVLIDLTPHIQSGKSNTITIKVTDPAGGMLGSWTANRASGLWHDLWLEASGKTFLADVYMAADIDNNQATANVTVIKAEGGSAGPFELSVALTSPQGERLAQKAQVQFDDGKTTAEAKIVFSIEKPDLWDTESPNLYGVDARLSSGEQVVDRAVTEFGMRKLETRDDRVYLNNKPIYLLGGGLDPGPYGGPLDVNYHFPPPYKPMDDEQMAKNVEQIKSIGVNFVRITLRPAPLRFLKFADRMGLLVWSEWPWHRGELYTKEGKPLYQSLLNKWASVALRDRNHPSIIMYGLFNEGVPVPHDLLHKMIDNLHALNPYPMIQDSAGGTVLSLLNYPESHIRTDLYDVHWYPALFNQRHARWLIEGTRSHNKPTIVSEFGPIPYTYNPDKVRAKWGGKLPTWATAQASSYAIYGTPSVDERFKRWKLADVWGDLKNFGDSIDEYYGIGLRNQIEMIRRNNQMTGLLPWVFESAPHPTGWFDFFGDKKVFADDLATIMKPDLVVLEVQGRRNLWEKDKVRTEVHISHFNSAEPLEGSVRWWLEGTDVKGELKSFSVSPGTVLPIGVIDMQIPEIGAKARPAKLWAEVFNKNGESVVKNYTDLFLFPLTPRKDKVNGSVYEIFGQRFSTMGFGSPAVMVTTRVDDAVTTKLEQGGTVILMACSDFIPGFPDLTERPLHPSVIPFLKKHGLDLGTKEQGAHSDSFYIKKTPGLFERIPYKNPMALPFLDVWPQYSILGMKLENQDDMLAGVFGMMIGSRAYDSSAVSRPGEVNATMAQFRYGKGKLIITTFGLLDPYADDPVATIMLNDLVNYAASPACEPKTRLK